jgi:hypothetical protein
MERQQSFGLLQVNSRQRHMGRVGRTEHLELAGVSPDRHVVEEEVRAGLPLGVYLRLRSGIERMYGTPGASDQLGVE